MNNKQGLKVVTMGGGTGSFMLLQGLKHYVHNITAIVNMVDDGGSSGVLRDELGALPPGDVRQCLVALSRSSDTVRELFSHRFDETGSVSGHSFGNLFLTALEQVTGSFTQAIETASEILATEGRVVPVTLTNTQLRYTSPSGKEVIGEHAIADSEVLAIDKQPALSFTNPATLNPAAHQALIEADIIVVAPGTVYGSLVPTLMVEGVADALKATKGRVVYIANLTSEHETTDYDVAHICHELSRFTDGNCLNYVVVNNRAVPGSVAQAYEAEGQQVLSAGQLEAAGVTIEKVDLLAEAALAHQLIRHDSNKVARAVMRIAFS